MNKFNEEADTIINSEEGPPLDEENSELCELENKEMEVDGDANAGDEAATEKTEAKSAKSEEDNNDILKLTMLINKYNSDLRIGDDQDRYKRDIKCTMFFNKEVTVRSNSEFSPVPAVNIPLPMKNPELGEDKGSIDTSTPLNSGQALICSISNVQTTELEHAGDERSHGTDNPTRRNQKIENDTIQPVEHSDIRSHNSLTSISRNTKTSFKGIGKSKNQSLTTLEMNTTCQSPLETKFTGWNDLTELAMLTLADDRKHCLQSSKSNNDQSMANNGNRRSLIRFKKGEETISASDSRLLNPNPELNDPVKKCDKKSRGDSSKKESNTDIMGPPSRKQVQWKSEVDVIYFSTHLGANGDRTGGVIERVIEPLREEWEQQRKGFYAKIVPYHIGSHLKDHFISLLKM